MKMKLVMLLVAAMPFMPIAKTDACTGITLKAKGKFLNRIFGYCKWVL